MTNLTYDSLATKVYDCLSEGVFYNFHSVYCDPSSPGVISALNALGIRAHGGNNNVLLGVNYLKTLFEKNKILIDQGCVNLLRELRSYRYEKDKGSKEFSETPVKRDDHAIDALRYGVLGSGDRPYRFCRVGFRM